MRSYSSIANLDGEVVENKIVKKTRMADDQSHRVEISHSTISYLLPPMLTRMKSRELGSPANSPGLGAPAASLCIHPCSQAACCHVGEQKTLNAESLR